MNIAKKYGDIYTFYMGQSRIIVLTKADMIHELLVGRPKNYSYRADNLMPGWGGNYPAGVISADGKQWVELRRLCSKGLRVFGLGTNKMLQKVQEEAGYLTQELNSRDGTVENQFNKVVANAICNVIHSQIFGSRMEYSDPKFIKLLQLSNTFFERPFKQSAHYLAFPFFRHFSIPPQVADALKIHEFVHVEVEKAYNEMGTVSKEANPQNFIELMHQEGITPHSPDFVHYCVSMADMLLAGLETTATATTWTVILFCKYPEIQRKCQEEIEAVVGHDRYPNMDDRPHMPYLESIMNEVLRWVTIVPGALFHATKEPDTYQGYEIPADSLIMYSVWGVHHDKEYWKDPEVFRPERWIGEDGKILDHSTHFMPFGTGPRKCLGDNLAKLEYFVFLITLLQRFDFSFPSEDYELDLLNSRHSITNVPPKFDVFIKKRF